MATDSQLFSANPSYLQCFVDIRAACATYFNHTTSNYNYPWDFFSDVRKYGSITSTDIYTTLALGVLWTLCRHVMTIAVFKPLARSMTAMKPANRDKFPESSFKFMYYTSTWTYCAWLLFFRHPLFTNPYTVWDDWRPLAPVATDIYVLYLVQCSFYLHSIYATVFMDVWRKDSVIMLFHHILTLMLIGFSFAVRYHKIGVLVLFVHDITDVALEGTKLNVYVKECGGRLRYLVHDALATIGFISFATTWFVFRLYWFPLKILHASAYGAMLTIDSLDGQRPPLWFFFNFMLWLLQILNIYWFMFILLLLYKIASGQIKELEDVREEKDDEDLEVMKEEVNGTDKMNGIEKRNGTGKLNGTVKLNGDVSKYSCANGTNGAICNGATGDHYKHNDANGNAASIHQSQTDSDDVITTNDDVTSEDSGPRLRKRPAGEDE